MHMLLFCIQNVYLLLQLYCCSCRAQQLLKNVQPNVCVIQLCEDDTLCNKYAEDSSYQLKFIWNNIEDNVQTTQVSDLWTDNCVFKVKFTSLEEVQAKIAHVDFNSSSLQTTRTYFCNLTNLQYLILKQNQLKDVAYVGLNLTGNCESNNYCGKNLNSLDLSHNNFIIVQNYSFCNLVNMLTIILDSCEIESIEVMAFANLKNLSHISMQQNKLNLLWPHLFKDNLKLRYLSLPLNNLVDDSLKALLPLTELYELNLSNNKIKNLRHLQNYKPTDIFRVDFSNNLLTSINNDLNNLTNIRYLNLHSNRINYINIENPCSFIEIDLRNNCLLHIPELNVLEIDKIDMSNNSLTTIDSFKLANFTNIDILNLSNNQISHILADAFFPGQGIGCLDLSQNYISLLNQTFVNLSISIILLDFNHLKVLSFDDFSPYTATLSLKNNQIDHIKQKSSFEDHNLIELYLSNNLLTNLQLNIPPSVWKVDLTGNNIKELNLKELFSNQFFQRQHYFQGELMFPTRTKEVLLSYNEIEVIIPHNYVGKNIIYYKFDVKIDLEGNTLKCSCENAWLLQNKSNIFQFVNNLQLNECFSTKSNSMLLFSEANLLCKSNYSNSNRCSVSHQEEDNFNCKFTCPFPCICYSSEKYTFIYLYCSNQQLTTIPSDFDESQMNNKQYLILHFDGNSYFKIKSEDFLNYSKVEQLYLNHSNIHKIENLTFNSLTTLTILHLGNNKIADLVEGIFDNLINLKELHLSNNLLPSIVPRLFLPLIKLEFLSLDNNHLNTFNIWELQSLKQLTVHHNPWTCECHFILQFQKFLLNHKFVIPNVNHVYCIENDLNNMSVIVFNGSQCFLTSIDSGLNIIIISVAAPFAFLVSIVVLVIIYYREIQVFIYAHCRIRLFAKQNDTEGKYYDAFVSYSNEDVQYVVGHFIPNLEQIDNPFKLCLHDRNFLPGPFIQDNIVQAINESCSTIVLLTENYLKSGWCLYEFKMAHAQMVSGQNHQVIVVDLGGLPTGIDEELKLYMKTNTYIKWNETLFWKKLHFAMADRRVSNSKYQVMEMEFVGSHF